MKNKEKKRFFTVLRIESKNRASDPIFTYTLFGTPLQLRSNLFHAKIAGFSIDSVGYREMTLSQSYDVNL